MKPTNLTTISSLSTSSTLLIAPRRNPLSFPFTRSSSSSLPQPCRSLSISPQPSKPNLPVFSSKHSNSTGGEAKVSSFEVGWAPSDEDLGEDGNLRVQVGSPVVPLSVLSPSKLSLSDQAFFLFAVIACTTSVAFTSLVVAAVPTLYAMGRAATSLAKLADTAREELPSTMTAIRLSGMEISDLTLELSDLSQEIADGVNKSAKAVQAAEAGIRQIGALAHHRTASMIQERASLPAISLQPVVAGAAKKTSLAVGQATKKLISIISRAEFSSDNGQSTDRVEL